MSFLDQLNPAQRDAVLAVDGPVIIIAGAGSGKTRVLTYRCAHLLRLGVRADSILALTFTNKAAGEMKERIGHLVGPESKRLWMGTFHSVFARILRMEGELLGYQRNFTIYDKDDGVGLVKSILNDLKLSQQQFSPQAILSRISHARNQMITSEAYAGSATDPMAETTAVVYREYLRRLKKTNAMDFDDLLLQPLELFTRHPKTLQRYQYRFRYILVDEYQDTNRVQYRLIRELARSHENICVVGDDAQSIYAFRGADIRNILDFERDYPKAKVFRLEQNYRSTKTILAAAASIIKNNVDQLSKKLWTENVGGDPVSLSACADEVDEGQQVVRHIREESAKRKLDLKDFAVLYRTNAQSRAIEDALRRNGIPYVIVGGVAFYKRKEIKDVLAYLRVLANPLDDESLVRIINVPARGIGETTLGKLRGEARQRNISLFDALGLDALPEGIATRTTGTIRAFRSLLMKYSRLKAAMSVSELARAMVDEIGILHLYKEENTQESLERRANVQELLSALSEFNAQKPDGQLEDFLEEVSLVSDVDTAEFGRNAVTLMTLHSAKGLEFPVVFITGLEEGLFPLANSSADRKDLEEERRLLYVGITRAMQKLYLSYALTRFQYGDRVYAVRSRFIDEIEPSVLTADGNGNGRTSAPYRRSGMGVTNAPSFPRPSDIHKRNTLQDPMFEDSMPAYEDESQEEVLEARVGLRVVHEAFGKGKIIAIDGRGESAKAVVDFESVGRKNLMLKFARLRPG